MSLIVFAAQAGTPSEWAKELQAISEAPFIFFGAFIFLYALTVSFSLWLIQRSTVTTLESRYRGQIDTLGQRIEQSKDNIERKNEKITELEKDINRLKEAQSQGGAVKQKTNQKSQTVNGKLISKTSQPKNLKNLSNSELREETIQIANEIQRITSKAESKTQLIAAKRYELENKNSRLEISDVGRALIEKSRNNKLLTAETNAAKAEAISAYREAVGDLPRQQRNEILRRLTQKPSECINENRYIDIENVDEMKNLASDLRRLISKLSEK